MKLVKMSDMLALGEAMADLKRLAQGPVHRLTISTEIIFGGKRLEPGTYEVSRVSPKPEDERF